MYLSIMDAWLEPSMGVVSDSLDIAYPASERVSPHGFLFDFYQFIRVASIALTRLPSGLVADYNDSHAASNPTGLHLVPTIIS